MSARFGDGKSFFLSRFVEDDIVKEKYIFLTIFPVNYQVTENRDIFDLIKRDIILQMLLKGVIETDVKISNEVALALCLQNDSIGFAEGFLPLLSEYALSGDAVKMAAIALAGRKLFKTIRQKIDEVKARSRDDQLDSFLSAVEKNPVVGQDAISAIIQQCIHQFKEKHPGKQVALIIEDLDRIDPAHLFRILNIFSAHIDFCYRVGCKPDESISGNKFGLDKVVFVMHYENVRNIYNHFYGTGTSFDGYIEKFCSSNHYCYSFQEEKSNYFLKQIGAETDLPTNVLDYLLKSEDFSDMSVRLFAQAIKNIDDSIISIPKAKTNNNIMISFHPGILRLITILRKCGINDKEIQGRIVKTLTTEEPHRTLLFSYLAHYLTYLNNGNVFSSLSYTCINHMTYYAQVVNIDKMGKAECNFSYSVYENHDVRRNLQKLLSELFRMVSE